MKRLSSLIISLVLIALCLVLASCGGTKPIKDDGTLEVVGFVKNDPAATDTGTTKDYNFKFELLGSGTAYQVVDNGYYTGKSIEIPATYNDKPVTTVAPYAFKNCKSLESITFSENIIDVPANAFYSCAQLNEIKVADGNAKYKGEGNCLIEIATNKVILGAGSSVIPNSVTAIEEHAFYGRDKLVSVVIPSSVTTVSEKAYYKCTSIDTITVSADNTVYKSKNSSDIECNCLIEKSTNKVILTCRWSNVPNDVSAYGEYAYASNPEVVSVVIPEGTTEISGDMLKGCSKIESVTIPASVTSISGFAFKDCPKLADVTIAEGNPKYRVESGCVIDKDNNSVVLGMCTATIPAGIVKIESQAFCGRNIIEIIIPEAVKEIGAQAFESCPYLVSVEFKVPNGWYMIHYIDEDGNEVRINITASEFSDKNGAAVFLATLSSELHRT